MNNINNKRPFEAARIEIEIIGHDVLTVSGFFGEEEEFGEEYYWDTH